mmetsp:Transcript_28612/g.37483  ORF Transcript_28612/g.37483 Transcript_28612/m.37483 type:complete len:437 (+) Transcript_28612:193-1503(+)|eukprot:CAMPEP_0117776076 /NCGR_PEP_ID=MMETSP0947-20121206/27534_1 /TAXON_ID=44440 /ORGANISM="Chattonella subsalsa, Strain CCMP2191" /LENGTH=436 /DNA_ID=CAMNT_0005602937 /DNA_START=200 /DNA_END=1510 /DNA_ORIENTATION=-
MYSACVVSLFLLLTLFYTLIAALDYPIVDTDQQNSYDACCEITAPSEGASYYGQDSQYSGHNPCYEDNGDGTVTDIVTGLMWTQDPGSRVNWAQAVANLVDLNDEGFAGYNDWRVPTTKELYSLILFSGDDPSTDMTATDGTPFIDRDYFDFEYGSQPWRNIDAQYITSTIYTGKIMFNATGFMGVNFADGRIKGYERDSANEQFFVHYVRGNEDYGENVFSVEGDLISDASTGLTWMKNDSGSGMFWGDALDYCEDLEYEGYSDWRLPNAKELQSIVDYTRSPDKTDSASINALFLATKITNEAGEDDFPWYWTSTTHKAYQATSNSPPGGFAVYVSFGRSLGNFLGDGNWIDVHGAGCQRSDPKDGDPNEYADGHGPQGDAIRIYNYVRCVRGGSESTCDAEENSDSTDNIESKARTTRPWPGIFLFVIPYFLF